MSSRRNLYPLVGLVVCAIGLVSYPTFFVQFPATRDLPWANWMILAVGVVLVATGVSRAFRRRGALGRVLASVAAALGVAIVGFFVFMTEIASRDLPPAAHAPTVGAKAPELALPDVSGRTVTLAELLSPASGSGNGSWLLLIFYRGHW